MCTSNIGVKEAFFDAVLLQQDLNEAGKASAFGFRRALRSRLDGRVNSK
jgi:hypothetical protein